MWRGKIGCPRGMDEYGRPIPSAERYLGGFQEVIDYVHNNGQKIGIYLIPGVSIDACNQDFEIYGTNGQCTIQDITDKPLTVMDYWNSSGAAKLLYPKCFIHPKTIFRNARYVILFNLICNVYRKNRKNR